MCGFGADLHNQHCSEACGEGDCAIDEFCPEKTLLVFRKKRDGCVTVLGYAAGKKHRERNDACCEQSDEDHMRTRFRNYAYGSGQKDHKHGVVTYPPVDVNVLKSDSQDKKHTEGPGEYDRKVPADNMVPEMFFHEMVRCEYKDNEHDDAKSCKENVHPVLTEEVYMEGSFFRLVLVVSLVMMFRFVMMLAVAVIVHMSGMMIVFVNMCACFVNMCACFVAAVVVAELAGGQGCDKDGESHEHRDPLPAEMTALMLVSVRLFVAIVHLVTLLAFRSRGLGESVYYDTDNNCNDEQDCKKKQGLIRNHCKHDEGLVS